MAGTPAFKSALKEEMAMDMFAYISSSSKMKIKMCFQVEFIIAFSIWILLGEISHLLKTF
jgi:hypothetical protein